MRKNFTFVSTILATSVMLISILASPSASAWSDAQTSVSVFGGSGGESSYSTVVDSSGNIYTTGYFTQTADFDPGAGVTNLTSSGSLDVFISKLNSSGALVWAKRFGGSLNEYGLSIAVDSSGNVYTTGYFSQTVDFDPGAGVTNLTSVGDEDAFISKLNSSGALVWAKSFGGNSTDPGISIAVDGSGNVYTTGFFYDTVDFDPGAGIANLTSVGNDDVFVSKLNSSGAFVWAKSFGGSLGDQGASIAVDSAGNVYTAGYFFETVDFDPGAGVTNLTSLGVEDVFISKLNSSGAFVWAKSFGGSSTDPGISIAVDGSGNVYTTGFFFNTVDFDPGAGIANITSVGDEDVFISKLNSSGALVWAMSFGGSSTDSGYSIAVDGSGNVYTTGYFTESVDFDPGAGVNNLTSSGNNDVFVSKLNSSGAFVWAKSFGGNLTDFANSIAVDGSGNVYTTGYFEGTVDFDPGAGVTNFTSFGSGDVFVSKLNSLGEAILSDDSDKSDEAARNSAAAAAAQRQRELTEILSLVPSIAGLSTNISELTNSLLFKQKCVKGKKAKYVKYGAKCPKGYTKKK